MKYFIYNIVFLLLLSACTKEQEIKDVVVYDINQVLPVRQFIETDDNEIYVCGGELWTGGFVVKSDNGQLWEEVIDHWKIINDIAFQDETGCIASFWGGAHLLNIDSNRWDYYENPDFTSINALHYINDSTIFFASGESFYFGGYGFINTNQNTFRFIDEERSFACLHFFDQQTGLLGAYGMIYRTEDGGQNIFPTNASGDYFKSISFNNDGKGIAIGYNGLVLKSNNYGVSWSKIDKKKSFFTSNGNLESVSVYEQQILIAGENGKLLLSNDFGDSWLSINHPFDKCNFYVVRFIGPNEVYLGGDNGLFCKIFL